MTATNPKVFILDIDGVMTTGQFFYSESGKLYKVFGPDDSDGLSLIKPHLEIRFVTGDKRGYPISCKRIIEDMKYPLDLVSTIHRVDWIRERYPLEEVIYMGDGLLDSYVFQKIGYAIAPENANAIAKKYANFVTQCRGAERAVAEACLHLLDKFFEPFHPDALPPSKVLSFGEWSMDAENRQTP